MPRFFLPRHCPAKGRPLDTPFSPGQPTQHHHHVHNEASLLSDMPFQGSVLCLHLCLFSLRHPSPNAPPAPQDPSLPAFDSLIVRDTILVVSQFADNTCAKALELIRVVCLAACLFRPRLILPCLGVRRIFAAHSKPLVSRPPDKRAATILSPSISSCNLVVRSKPCPAILRQTSGDATRAPRMYAACFQFRLRPRCPLRWFAEPSVQPRFSGRKTRHSSSRTPGHSNVLFPHVQSGPMLR